MRFAANVPGIADFLSKGPDYAATHGIGLKARNAEEMKQLGADGRITASKIGAKTNYELAKQKADIIGMQYGAQASEITSAGNQALFGGIGGGALSGAFSSGGMFNFGGGSSSVAATNVAAGRSPGLGIPISDYMNYGYDPRV